MYPQIDGQPEILLRLRVLHYRDVPSHPTKAEYFYYYVNFFHTISFDHILSSTPDSPRSFPS